MSIIIGRYQSSKTERGTISVSEVPAVGLLLLTECIKVMKHTTTISHLNRISQTMPINIAIIILFNYCNICCFYAVVALFYCLVTTVVKYQGMDLEAITVPIPSPHTGLSIDSPYTRLYGDTGYAGSANHPDRDANLHDNDIAVTQNGEHFDRAKSL